MKKILLATTILSMSAGFAAADVAVSGSARMGVVSSDGDSAFSSRVRMTFTGSGTTDGGLAFGGKFDAQDAQGANVGSSGSVYISGAFGKISMGDVGSGDGAAVGQLASVGYTGLGSTNSINYAADGVDGFGLNDVLAVSGSIAHGVYTAGSPAYDNVSDAGGAKVLYTYAAGGLSVSASTAQLTNGGSTAYGVGAAYTTGGLTVAVGYGSTDATYNNIGIVVDTDYLTNGTILEAANVDGFAGTVKDSSVSATYVMGATSIKGIYQLKSIDLSRPADEFQAAGLALDPPEEDDVIAYEIDADGNLVDSPEALGLNASATSMGMSVSHTIDALTLTAFSVSTELDLGDLAGTGTVVRSGLGVAYDLGGGATVKAGWVNANTVDFVAPSVASEASPGVEVGDLVAGSISDASYNVMDVGVTFSF